MIVIVDPQIGFSELATNELPVPGANEQFAADIMQFLGIKDRILTKDAHSPGKTICSSWYIYEKYVKSIHNIQ